jgi:hypothetical protein
MTASRHPLRRYGPAALMLTLIPALSLLPARFFSHIAGAPAFPGLDKLIHSVMYAALTVALFHALSPSARVRFSWVIRLVLAASLYGLAMEVCQKLLTRSRSFDPLDALSNAVGAFLCALTLYALARFRSEKDATFTPV